MPSPPRTRDEQICIAFPTIMSGLVLRWYASVEAYRADEDELASAGREAALFSPGCPDELRSAVQEAHEHIRAVDNGRSHHVRPDVSRWVTHTTTFMSDEVTPISREVASND